MFPRRIASLVLLALLGVAGFAPATAGAQPSRSALRVFTSARFGYTLRYPATWHSLPSTQLDILVQAPDAAARVAGKGIDGGLSAAGLRQVVDSTIGRLNAPRAKILRTTRVIQGVTFQMEQATFTYAGGVEETAMVLGTSQHQRTYLFFGIVGLGRPAAHVQAPHAQVELRQIQATFASITISR